MGYFTNQSVISSKSFYSSILEEYQEKINPQLLTAVLQETSITNAVLVGALSNIANKAENFYQYGESTFTNGLPQGTSFFSQNNVNPTTIESVLEGIEGEPVTVLAYYLQRPFADIFSKEYMQNNQGWDSETNSFTNPPDFNDPDGQNGEEYITSELSGADTLITYSYYDDDSTSFDRVNTTQAFTISKLVKLTPGPGGVIVGDKLDEPFYQVVYIKNSEPNKRLYWTYDPASGTYPELEYPETPAPFTSYYPLVPLKANGNYTVELDEADPLRVTSQRALNTVGISLQEITNSVKDNPDEDKVDDALVAFAVNLNTTSQPNLDYLVSYFKDLQSKAIYQKIHYDDWLDTVDAVPRQNPYNSIEIEDEDFYMQMVFNYIEVETKSGSIGDIGEITKTFDLNAPKTDRDEEGDDLYYADRNVLYLRKQLTANTYEEITVHGLVHIAKLYGLEDTLTVIETNLRHVDEDGEGGFFIPLDRAVINTFSRNDQVAILTNTLALLITASQKVWLSWYETGIGKALILIAAAVIFYLSFDVTGFVALVETYGVIYAVVIALAQLAVKYAVTNYIVKKLIQEFGEEEVGILYAILVVASFFVPSGNPLYANALLDVTNALGVGIGQYRLDELQEIQNEYTQLLLEEEELQEKLEQAADLLDTGFTDPFTITRAVAYNDPNETPEQYLFRTIHLTNPGVLSLDYAENYHAAALTLPEPDTTMNIRI